MERYKVIKRISGIIAMGLLLISLPGCSTVKKLTQAPAGLESASAMASLNPYSGPKAKIAVADFEVRAIKATGEIGLGLREMFVTALLNSNRFSVVERQAPAADLIILVAITEFEPQTSGGSAGVGGGGGVGSGILGGLLGATLNKARIALDIRIKDASTSGVLSSKHMPAQASDVAGSIMEGSFGSSGLGSGLFVYANTPMEKAIRICIIEAVRYICQSTPKNYYKYK